MNTKYYLELLNRLDDKNSFEAPSSWTTEDYRTFEKKVRDFFQTINSKFSEKLILRCGEDYQDASFGATVSFVHSENCYTVFRFSHFGEMVCIFSNESLLSETSKEKFIKYLELHRFVFLPKEVLQNKTNDGYTWEDRFFGYS